MPTPKNKLTIDGKELVYSTVPSTGEERWIDFSDSKDFDGTTGYRWYDSAGNKMNYTKYQEADAQEYMPTVEEVDSHIQSRGDGSWLSNLTNRTKSKMQSLNQKLASASRNRPRWNTTGGAGYIPTQPLSSGIKLSPERIYNRIPGDQWYNVVNEDRENNYGVSGVLDAVRGYLSNEDNYVEKRLQYYSPYKDVSWKDKEEADKEFYKRARGIGYKFDKLSKKERSILQNLDDKATAPLVIAHEDAKDEYLGLPQRFGTLKKSEYYPTQGKLNNGKYITYMRDPSFVESILLPTYNDFKIGKKRPNDKKYLGEVFSLPSYTSNVVDITPKGNAVVHIPFLNNATMSSGYDDRGEYMSIYDTWDYNTKVYANPGDDIGQHISGKPFDIYDRYYLDDVYGVETPTHATYLPEVEVVNNKAQGGPVEAEEKDFQPAWWQSIPNTYTGRWQYEDGGSLNTHKQWQDLPIKEKADIMKVAIRNGITNLADIKAKYNEFALGGNMASNESVNLYGRGSQMNRGAWRTQHQRRWYSFLKRKGLNDNDASRLSGFFAAQDGFESAGGTSSAARQKNNFGGMQRGGKNISYPSVEAYMEDKWNMMNSKFRSALGARSIDEYATILGNPNTAGKGYLYYVTDQAKYDPQSPAWRAAQTKHMHNYINGMRSWAGQGTVKFGNDDYSYNQSNWPQGYVYDVLPQLFAMDGVPITVSSGYRPGAVVKGTNRASRHGMRQAADIVGDFAKIQQVLDNPNSNVSRWMLANGYGYLNETSGPGGTTKHWKDHNRDHSHYHIGMDSSLAQQYAARFGGMSPQPQNDNDTLLAFEPSNPQAFFAPLSSYEIPVEQTPIQPLVDAAEQQYKAEMAERQRAMQQNNNMLALVSYLNNSGNQDSSPFGVFNLLSGSQIEA